MVKSIKKFEDLLSPNSSRGVKETVQRHGKRGRTDGQRGRGGDGAPQTPNLSRFQGGPAFDSRAHRTLPTFQLNDSLKFHRNTVWMRSRNSFFKSPF